jgi:hypothetical protein
MFSSLAKGPLSAASLAAAGEMIADASISDREQLGNSGPVMGMFHGTRQWGRQQTTGQVLHVLLTRALVEAGCASRELRRRSVTRLARFAFRRPIGCEKCTAQADSQVGDM